MGISQSNPNVASGVHGNSLVNTKTNYGYALVDKNTGEILKFGETLYPNTRYSKSYLESINAQMNVLVSGSKYDIHMWQHQQIVNYLGENAVLPPLNKTGW